jgi:hypothetical protein
MKIQPLSTHKKIKQMKPQHIIKSKLAASVRSAKIIVTLVGREIAAVMASMLIISSGMAQTKTKSIRPSFGFGVMAQVTADGYGCAYLPSALVVHKRNTFVIAPVVQKRNLNVSGVQAGWQYALTGEPVTGERGPELFLTVHGAYQPNALMGIGTLRNEYTANRQATEDKVHELRFRSAELFAGVGCRFSLIPNLKWVNRVAIGGNTSFGFPSCEHMYFSGKNFGLSLATGLTYTIQ